MTTSYKSPMTTSYKLLITTSYKTTSYNSLLVATIREIRRLTTTTEVLCTACLAS